MYGENSTNCGDVNHHVRFSDVPLRGLSGEKLYSVEKPFVPREAQHVQHAAVLRITPHLRMIVVSAAQ